MISLARALDHPWQFVLLAAAVAWLLLLRRGVLPALLLAAVAGIAVPAAGLPVTA